MKVCHPPTIDQHSGSPYETDKHIVILVNPGHDIDQLKKLMQDLLESSPNTAEPLRQYKSKETIDSVQEIRVKWATEGRGQQFPKATLLTEENCEPVLRMMAIGVGKDVFDVKLQTKKVEAKK